MRKGLYIVLAVIITVSLTACGAPAAETTSPSAPAETPGVVTFADPVLEAMIREAMGKPEGDITIADAEAVTELKLGIEWQQQIPEETQIKDLSGIEHFTNLKNLELSFHAITDITPLAGLTKLESLSLGGNPVGDIAPLSGLSNLGFLTLFNCQAKDYTPLASLAKLGGLLLEYSTISDVSMLSGLTGLWWLSLAHTQVSDVTPLATLTNLKKLQLADCPIIDYSPLADIYPNLEEKDFTAVFTLAELGFTKPDNSVLASYNSEGLTVTVNHSEWGIPDMNMEANTIRLYLDMDEGYKLTVGYDPGNLNYVFNISQDGESLTDYVYITSEDSLMFNGDRERVENAIRTMLGDTDSDDILLAPIPVFNDTIRETFGMTAASLFALPFEPPTLLSLGFTADEANAVCIYEQREGTYTSIAIHRPEWGEQEYSIHFFTLVNGYGVMVRYYQDEQRFYVRVGNDDGDDGGGSYADFEFFPKDGTKNDYYSPEGMTVEEFLQNVYNDPEIEDVFLYSVQLMEQYISDTFGMSIDDLYALPVGE